MSNYSSRIQVIIPYKQLCELLEASSELKELRKENAWQKEQILALRGLFIEVLDKIAEIDSYM